MAQALLRTTALLKRRESARFKYQLRAVSEHRGVPQTGHFATYRRGLSDEPHAWYLTNDSQNIFCYRIILFLELVLREWLCFNTIAFKAIKFLANITVGILFCWITAVQLTVKYINRFDLLFKVVV
uniref:UCH domain-containing protein n=1 Tax=Heterorhabditis bacteriophora TaxID=37862 RepID=A0A1I7X7Z2_HETBA